MSDDPSKKMSREDRMAAKLRENLRKRKAQARELGAGTDAAADASAGESVANRVPKPKPES